MKHKELALFFISFLLYYNGKEYIVHPNHGSFNHTGFTLKDYIKNSTLYFKSNSKFILLPGHHNLSHTLTIDSITDLVIKGVNAKETSIWTFGSSIEILNSSNIIIKKVIIQHTDYLKMHSFLNITKSLLIHIQDVHFLNANFAINTSSRAACISSSQVTICKCSFYGGYSSKGGALNIEYSNVSYFDTIIFEQNWALI